MNKQTAVDWFQEQIIHIVKGTCELSEAEIYAKAKEMEKKQITQSFVGGSDFREINKNRNRGAVSYADQYYRNNYRSING